jgi:hypothetical protein
MATARKRLEILQPNVDEIRGERARQAFRFVLASQWKLGEARFTVAETNGRTEFLGADGRALGGAFAFTLAEVRAALVADFGVRRGWLRTQRPLDDVAATRLQGALVALRLEEDAARGTLRVEFLVPRDDAPAPATQGSGRFSL